MIIELFEMRKKSMISRLLLDVSIGSPKRMIIELFKMRKKSTISRLLLDVSSTSFWGTNGSILQKLFATKHIFDDASEGVRDEEVIVGECVVVISSSLEMLTNSCLGGIMVSLILLEGLEEEALVEFMVELFKEDDKKREGVLAHEVPSLIPSSSSSLR
uniref:Uncharacterized protein n=1 Tax=Tanacetum cinerariifolium TaxID=118510 RepID=A0A6L2KA26_TANCI|nr:hypothetical protein [Tanacetum cinerariifolium]